VEIDEFTKVISGMAETLSRPSSSSQVASIAPGNNVSHSVISSRLDCLRRR
jgi:hypothetical protein